MRRLINLWSALGDDYAALHHGGDRKALWPEMLLGAALQVAVVVLAILLAAAVQS